MNLTNGLRQKTACNKKRLQQKTDCNKNGRRCFFHIYGLQQKTRNVDSKKYPQ